MKKTPILLDERFEKSLPRAREKEILQKVADFARDYTQYQDEKERMLKYGVDKVSSGTKLKAVWKFRASKSERILFVKGKDIPWHNDAYQDALIFIAFCDHDTQIRKARSIGELKHLSLINNLIDDTETENIDEIADAIAKDIEYNPEESITRVFKNIDITTLVDGENLTGIYHLNQEQRQFVNQDLRPLILFGSAGSGKTTIGVYKVFALMKQALDIKIGYFTYSNYLLKTARNIYEKVIENEIPMEASERDLEEAILDECVKQKPVDFYNIRAFLLEHTNTSQLVELDEFSVFYRSLLDQVKYKKFVKKVDAFDAWKEIRGIIKGFAGMNWDPCVNEGIASLLDEKTYYNLKEHYTSFEKEDRRLLHEIAIEYTKWLESQNLFDENDLSRRLIASANALPQFDWIIIDEVQDLTEIEIYLLHKMVKDKNNILISGDFHQTINPTYFDTRRISTLLKVTGTDYTTYPHLTMNYRNAKVIVDAANALSCYRKKIFGKDGRNDQPHEHGMRHTNGTINILSNNQKEKLKLLKDAIQKAYVYIVVPNQVEKQKLMALLQTTTRIFTISEIKGIENNTIICVNMFTAYRDKWETIINNERLKQTNFYKYLFNMIYVAITRAKNDVCFIDDTVDLTLYDVFFKEKMVCEYYDPITFHFEQASTEQDFYQYALKLEESELYEAALIEYQKLQLAKAHIGARRCKAAILKKHGEHDKAGLLYEEVGEYQEALWCYKHAGNQKCYIEGMLRYAETDFIKEILCNPAMDYSTQIKPYIQQKELKEKFEQLCIILYGNQYGKVIKKTESQLTVVMELEQKLKKMNQKLEEAYDGR
ncbi:MAG: UvrD-helicase domain-containing protein [Cellulosilyticaceae bacterium]